MPKLYKITGMDGEAINGGNGTWFLPVKDRPGKWMPKVERVVACSSGYHLISAKAIFDWLPNQGLLWEAEGRGASSSSGEKTAFAQARLLKRVGVLDDVSLRLAAADIAEHVLPIFQRAYPNDDRPAKAIQAARDFANGRIDRAAAWAAADAAWAAADAAGAAGAAAWAAGAAAGAAAWAARAAAWAARAAARSARGATGAVNARIIIKQARLRAAQLD